MTIQDIRFANYMTLKSDFAAKEQVDGITARGRHQRFSESLQISPRYLSHINNQRKYIGHSTARKVEAVLGLPFGWMDYDHSTMDKDSFDELIHLCMRFKPQEVRDAISKIASEILIEQCQRVPGAKAG